ncbi:zinc-dependent metalloprotease [Segatella baroniae]|uniref:zinc-dependent metalloprotease n=1 Tax=Segatella baroniae TaxID=305719 RepID=UPI0004061272|nr:zinc-dependent metalloprotease [Segatella baroniae]
MRFEERGVVFEVTSLLGKPTNLLPVMPTHSGNYTLKATPKPELSFIRGIKSFDTNLTVYDDFTYTISTSLMSMPIGGERPTTVGVNYSVTLLPQSMMRPRIMDSRVGVDFSVRLGIPQEGTKSRQIYYSHRWNLIPKDKKAYAKGRLSEPVAPIRFYLDDAFPETWKQPIREGILRWNKAFERIGFRHALEVVDFPQKQAGFDPDNIRYSCIRYIPNGSSAEPTSDVRFNPNTGEIMNASMFIYSNVETLLHKWRFVETAAVDPSVRSNRLSAEKFAEGLSMLVTREAGRMLGLLENPGASSTYPTDSLRNARFTSTMGLAPSVMDDVHYNYVAQPSDRGVALAPTALGMYDHFTIDWNYRYFDPDRVSIDEEKKTLEAFVDGKVKNPRLRFYAGRNAQWDPRVQAGALGNDAIASANLAIRNLRAVQSGLSHRFKNDEDSRIKDKLYLSIAQTHYALYKQVLANVGGIHLNDMKVSSGTPRYQVVGKDLQRRSLQWSLQQAVNFTRHADRSFERKGFMAVSYYDQTLEFMAYDLLAARTRVAVSSFLAPGGYTQKEYFDDVYKVLFASAEQLRAPSQGERVLQRTFVNYAQSAVSKATGSGASGASGGRSVLTDGAEGATPGFGTPGLNLAPNVDINLADKSELYFYSCLLKLQPVSVENAMGPSWVDPRTGEIVTATVLVYNDVINTIDNWRFVQTAQLDPAARTASMPDSIVASTLEYIIAHEIGHTLGFMHNMAASAAFPTDSLRSATFTRQYGTTPSIMDYARFNYVAQPSDRGVALTPPSLGVYDYYALEWAYRVFPRSKGYKDDVRPLRQLIDAHAGDPMYRYGLQQSGFRYDPTAIEEDLGDDPLKASDYGLQNLNYILGHFDAWIPDGDGARKAELYRQMVSQAYGYVRNVYANVSGIRLYQTTETSGLPRYRVVPKDRQRAAALWMLDEARRFGKRGVAEIENRLPQLASHPYKTLASGIQEMALSATPRLALSFYLDSTSYSPLEYCDDVYRNVWAKTIARNEALDEDDIALQKVYVEKLKANVDEVKQVGKVRGLHDAHADESFLGFGSGYGEPETMWMATVDRTAEYVFHYALKLKQLLEERIATTRTPETKAHYVLLHARVQKYLNT